MNFMFNKFLPSSRAIIYALKRNQPNFIQKSHFSKNPESNHVKSMEGLVKCSANYIPLSPISFLERAAIAYGNRVSVIYGTVKFTWRQTLNRCLKLASSLTQLGISRGDVVATLSPNVPAMYELHFGVPMAGAILCTLNTRHDSVMISILLKHSEAKVVFVDYQFLEVARVAFDLLSKSNSMLPRMVLISASENPTKKINNTMSSDLEYEKLLEMGDIEFDIRRPIDEFDPISINYTSGTTSNPKGVVYSHRGSYLNSLATVMLHGMGAMPVYLWTVPMFHCNGWCLTWGVAAQGGTNVCLRNVTPKGIYDSITLHKVTHMGGAPTVLNMIVNAPDNDRRAMPCKVDIMTGGSAPPPKIIFKMEELGFNVSHLYGLTETYGPATICAWQPEWDSSPPDERAKKKSRQGVQHIGLEVDIKNPVTLESVPDNGKTMGEVMFRGNTVMNGYFKDLKATEEALSSGWFRSGDLAVKHSDGFIEIKDRCKDIVISGGENISTIEVESVLFSHPSICEAAVVGRPDNHWGETPCAFVKLKDGCTANAEEIIQFCKDRLPRYMAPKTIVFADLPKTSTGKTQKYILREKAKSMGSLS